MRTSTYAIIALLFIFFSSPLQKTGFAQADQPFTLEWELYRLSPENESNDLMLVFWMTPQNGWYAYAAEPNLVGQPPTIRAFLNDQQQMLPAFFPPGEDTKDVYDPTITIKVFKQKTPFFVPLSGVQGPTLKVRAEVDFLLCSDKSCYPVSRMITINKPVSEVGALPLATNQSWWPAWKMATIAPQKSIVAKPQDVAPAVLPQLKPTYFNPSLEVSNLAKAIALAFLAGLILNLMPCVLPVLTLKLKSIMTSYGDGTDRLASIKKHNIGFSLGILSFFFILALLASFAGLAWGEFLQHEKTLAVLIALVFLLGLSLLDVIHIPIINIKGIGVVSHSSIGVSAYFTGIISTLLATPCSGPFLGGVLAWALFQSPIIIICVFVTIGLGMASPYLLVMIFPKTVAMLPKPGSWSKIVEHLFGFLLFATCIYLISLLPESKVFTAYLLLFFTGLAAVIWGKWRTLNQSLLKRTILGVFALSLFCIGLIIQLMPQTPPSSLWETYDPLVFSSALGRERMVVEFTADWCPNCKFLEKAVLTDVNMTALQEKYGFKAIKVDLSEKNPHGKNLLHSLGSQTIPTLAIFSTKYRGTVPLVLRDMYTKGQLEDGLKRAFQ